MYLVFRSLTTSLGNPNLFHALTQKQAEAAKATLSAPIKDSKDNEHQRFFNLDIAKMLYVSCLNYANARALTCVLSQPTDSKCNI
jgi:hypothetical protein